ncbi:XRE family transcriptional regulator [Anaerotruncus sp. 1XD22-93]|nr:XRE family transcriptional regulator [Lachnospiraceae bacterium]NBI74037.1 XRE family transcriptional regulator [Lachnospiraceae bacterium]RKK00248.1 XRE family transcriptional regulator [Anaerotruncus sp. 1XD22-93]
MNTSDIVKKLCEDQNISLAELARRTGQSRQNLYKKLRNETLGTEELNRIADALGVKFEQAFILSSGEKLTMEGERTK